MSEDEDVINREELVSKFKGEKEILKFLGLE